MRILSKDSSGSISMRRASAGLAAAAAGDGADGAASVAGFGRRGNGRNLRGRHRLVLLHFGFAREDVKVGPLLQPGAIARKGPHALRRAGFQGGNNFEEVAVADEVLDRHAGFENFAFRHADVQVGAELQPLGNDRDQAVGQLRGDVVSESPAERR